MATTSTERSVSMALSSLLLQGVEGGVFPGATAGFAFLDDAPSEWSVGAAGKLAPGEATVLPNTPYDLASLTKPVVAMASLRLVQARRMSLCDSVAAHLPRLARTQAADRTLRELLSHRAGLEAWQPLYALASGPVGSKERWHSALLLAADACDQPRGATLYSDLGYILAGAMVAAAGGRPLGETVEGEVLRPARRNGAMFFPAHLAGQEKENFLRNVAPTELCAFRHRLPRGEVHDENCASLGGIAGHAGLFGDVRGVLAFGVMVLASLRREGGHLGQELMVRATPPEGNSGEYGLGWDQGARGSSAAGTRLGPRTFGHLGFTGTSLFVDPDTGVAVALLSNRVHPSRHNTAIRQFRPHFHNAIVDLFPD